MAKVIKNLQIINVANSNDWNIKESDDERDDEKDRRNIPQDEVDDEHTK
jgi:hypothetical protein